MAVKLTERAKVKDLLGIARSDSLQNDLLDGLIEQNSEQVEELCRRSFTKAARTEYYQSYDQDAYDPCPQYLWLDGPIDKTQLLEIKWAPYDQHDEVGIALTGTDYQLDEGRALIIVRAATGPIAGMPIARGLVLPVFTFAPRGFQVRYTGGYPVSEKPDNEPIDPMDDYGVTQVPNSLKAVVAFKCATDWKEGNKMALPWVPEQVAQLKPWKKKDVLGA